MKQLKLISWSILMFAILGCTPQGETKDGNVESIAFVKNRFPNLDLPLRLNSKNEKYEKLSEKEKEKYFPEDAKADYPPDIFSVGQVSMFEGFTTLIFKEQVPDIFMTEYFIVSFPKGKFSASNAVLLPIGSDPIEDIWTEGELTSDGKFVVEETTDGQKFTKTAEYIISKNNQLEEPSR